jgi:hypothetical protein
MLIHRALKSAAVAAAVIVLSFSFAGSARAQQCGSMDVVFIVDETGSMGGVIGDLQGQVAKIADEVVKASGGDYQFALVGMPDNNIRVLLEFSANNRAQLTTAIGQLGTAGGCGGVPYDEALNTVVHGLKQRTGSSGAQLQDFNSKFRAQTKIIILITDTVPQAFTCSFQPGVHDKAAHTFAEDAKKADIHISAVYVPTGNTPEDLIKSIMQDVAATSGGFFKEAQPDASDVAEIAVDILSNCGGAAGGGGVSNLLIEPTELALLNGQTGEVKITNFNPSTKDATVVYSAEFAEPDDFTTVFTPVTKSDVDATEQQILKITVGPRTFQGEHLIGIRASKGTGTDDFTVVHVIVDCIPPYFLSNGNPQNASVARGSTTTLKATASGDGPFRYQWYRGHSGITTFPVAGATSATLTTDAVTGTAEYWVRVENACGSRDSATAVVTPQ